MEKSMRIYLAGPMRGLPNMGMDAFDRARKRLEDAGHLVFCPAQLVRAIPYKHAAGMEDRESLRHVALLDISCIMAADALYLLPGWEGSRGATMEVSLAQFLGLPLYCAETWQQVHPPTRPWGFLRETLPGFGS